MRILQMKRREQGFTLLESLLALAIFGIAIVAVVTALWTGTKTTIINNDQAMADSLARSQLEYIAGKEPYQHVPADYGTNPELVIPAGSGWELSTSVTRVNATDDGLQRVTVSVVRNGKQVLAVTTYKADVN